MTDQRRAEDRLRALKAQYKLLSQDEFGEAHERWRHEFRSVLAAAFPETDDPLIVEFARLWQPDYPDVGMIWQRAGGFLDLAIMRTSRPRPLDRVSFSESYLRRLVSSLGEPGDHVEAAGMVPASSRAAASFYALTSICEALYPGTARTGPTGAPEKSRSTFPQFGSASIVPMPGDGGMRFVDSLISKIGLYSGLTVFVVPGGLSGGYISYSASGSLRLDHRTPDHLARLMRYNQSYRDLVSTGTCVFLPTVTDVYSDSASTYGDWRTVAPLQQRPGTLTFGPINSTALSSTNSLGRELVVYEQILLPYFPDADLTKIALIAEKESDAFLKFHAFLISRVKRLAAAEDASAVEDIILEIRSGVADLRTEAKKLRVGKLIGSVEVGLFGLSLGALLVPDVGVIDQIAGIVGTASLFQLLQTGAALKAADLDMRNSEFFVPYLLAEAPSDTRTG